MSLPLVPTRLIDLEARDDGSGAGARCDGIRVLIVDDHELVRLGLRALLQARFAPSHAQLHVFEVRSLASAVEVYGVNRDSISLVFEEVLPLPNETNSTEDSTRTSAPNLTPSGLVTVSPAAAKLREPEPPIGTNKKLAVPWSSPASQKLTAHHVSPKRSLACALRCRKQKVWNGRAPSFVSITHGCIANFTRSRRETRLSEISLLNA